MRTLTNNQRTGLPKPPITAAEVSPNELPHISLDDGIGAAVTGIAQEAEQIGRKRNDSKQGEGTLHGSRNAEEAHLIGCIGELIATTIGLPPTGQDEISSEGDPGWDHSLLGGEVTIDTKATSTNVARPKLVVDASDTPPADFFLLVHIRDGIGRIVGFSDRHTVTSQRPERWPGKSKNYVLTWSDLYPPRFVSSLVIARAVTETRDDDFIHPTACQLCGAHLDDNAEERLYIGEELDREIGLCPEDCSSLLRSARDQGRATQFKLYRRPP